uniref:C2 domain-containing protein n=1 Tax=Kalanchoe fedtschenkoi TaxID=63787 RepID=A0A7N1A044_KALFE
MECRNLEIFVRSATDLKEMNVIGKMDPYVSVYLSGDPNSKQKTEVDTDGGKNPKWKGKAMKFVINEDLAKSSDVTLVFKIMAEKPFGDKEIGEVYVPVKDLLEDGSAEKAEKSLSYSVKTPSGKTKGTLNLAYKLGEKFTVENTATKDLHEPVTAYPPTMAAGSSSFAPGAGYPPPPPYGSGQYPQQAGYGYPPAGYGAPPQPGYGYPGGPPPQPGYGYPGAPPPGPYGYPGYPPAPGYGGYPGAPPMQMAQPQKKKSGMGMGGVGLGIGAGLLGGLLIGDMVSDVGEMAAYDAGFDDGLDF